KILLLKDRYPDAAAINRQMWDVLKFRLDPTCMKTIMAEIRNLNSTTATWEKEGLAMVMDFIKSGRMNIEKEQQATLHLARSNVAPANANPNAFLAGASSSSASSSSNKNSNFIVAPEGATFEQQLMCQSINNQTALVMMNKGHKGQGKHNN
ncbi:unnamed protein product, partial [Amoebophrya sp. A120]